MLERWGTGIQTSDTHYRYTVEVYKLLVMLGPPGLWLDVCEAFSLV
jgi:hypothetical protein